MIQLFRERSFGDIFNDTFVFFRENGRHFFKNYIILNGGLMLLIAVLSYVLFDVFKDAYSQNPYNNNPTDAFEAVFFQNTGLIIGVSVLLFILFLLVSLLNYSYPVIYLSLYETREADFTASDILKKLWSRMGKILLFFFASIFVMGPIILFVGGLNVLLMLILIGIPLLLIVFPAIINWVSLSFYEYINTDSSYFNALGGAFGYLKQNFWKFVGATLLFYFMIQSIMGVVTFIPYTIAIANVMTNTGGEMESAGSTVMLIVVVFLVAVTILNLVLTNFILVAQGMMFYSCKEAESNVSTSGEIDNIGLHFE